MLGSFLEPFVQLVDLGLGHGPGRAFVGELLLVFVPLPFQFGA
ncbi:hypothetical protein [Streptomyces sp. NRAIS3]